MSEKNNNYIIPKSIVLSPFELVFENFRKALMTTSNNSTLLLSVLLPYIELFAKMKFYSSKEEKHKSLLKEFGVHYPNLCWHIFRNGCAHTTSPDSIILNRGNIRKLWWGTTYVNNIENQFKKPPSKPLKVESIVKSEDFILYSIDINNLINNLIFYFKNEDTLTYKTPKDQRLSEIKNRNHATYKEILQLLDRI